MNAPSAAPVLQHAASTPAMRQSAVPPPPPPPPPPSASPPPPSPTAAASSAAESTLRFLSQMMPHADALVAGMAGVETAHPLAELLFEAAMSVREALNLYAAASPALCAAVAANNAQQAAATAATTLASPSQPPPAPPAPVVPRLHEAGLESLFTRNQKVQTLLQQRLWMDRSAMSHRTQLEVAPATVASASHALAHGTAPSNAQLQWSALVVYKKGHELLALDTAALSSLNLASSAHLGASFANGSNVAVWGASAPLALSPFKLLLDLRWVSGVREVNGANASSSKELGCELLVKFADALPLGAWHATAACVVTHQGQGHGAAGPLLPMGSGCAGGVGTGVTGPAPGYVQPTPERFLHLRFGTDSERQKVAHLLRAAIARNAVAAQVARQPVPQRVALWKELGLMPPAPALDSAAFAAAATATTAITNGVTSNSGALIPIPTAALAALERSFLFVPRFLPLSGGLGHLEAPTGLLGMSVPVAQTPAQASLLHTPFSAVWPVVWPTSTMLTKNKARVIELLIFPHQSQPAATSQLAGGAGTGCGAGAVANWNGPRSNQLRIWKHAAEKGSGSGSSGNSGGSGGSSSVGGAGGSSFESRAQLHSWGAQGLTGLYADLEEKECSITITPAELVDFRVGEGLDLELTCYVPHKDKERDKAAGAKEEGAYNGRNTRSSSFSAPALAPAPPSPGNAVMSAAAAALQNGLHMHSHGYAHNAAAGGSSSLEVSLHSKYTTRRFLFHSPAALRRFMDALRWFQQSHREPDSIDHRWGGAAGDWMQLKLREWNDRMTRPSVPALMPPAGAIAQPPPPPMALPVTTKGAPTPLQSHCGAAGPTLAAGVRADAAVGPAALPLSGHLHSLLWSMHSSFPSSRHCADLWLLTKDLDVDTNEGVLERIQLIVRKLYACGPGGAAAAAGGGPAAGGVERGTGMSGMGDLRNLVCTCPNALHSRAGTGAVLSVPPPPARAPPPSPAAVAAAAAAGVAPAAAAVASSPPSRPPPAANSCYLFFFQIFLACRGFADLRFILADTSSGPNSCAATKRWALRGVWALYEFVKPLLSTSSVPPVINSATMPSAATAATGGTGAQGPASGSLRGHQRVNSSSSGSFGDFASSFAANSSTQNATHWGVAHYSSMRCKNKLISAWEEDSNPHTDAGLALLFKLNFSAFITGLVQPGARNLAHPSAAAAAAAAAAGQGDTAAATGPMTLAPALSFHESLIDVLFELAVGTVRLDMVFSTTSTIEPITTYLNPATPTHSAQNGSAAGAIGSPGRAGPSLSPSPSSSSLVGGHFSSYQLKRESRVQVLNKPLVHLWLLPLILHLLPHGPLASSVLVLESLTWLTNGSGSSPNPNIALILWNMLIGQGNFGGNFFTLINLANHSMEAAALAQAQAHAAALASGTDPALLSPSKRGLNSSLFGSASGSSLMGGGGGQVQKGSWLIFLDTSRADSSPLAPGDPALVFNLTVTLFTTLHHHSMLIHQNAANLFLMGPTAGAGAAPGTSAAGASTGSGDFGAGGGALVASGNLSSPAGSLAWGPTDGTGDRDRASLALLMSSSCDSAERLRFRSLGLFRSLESLRSLNGWNESSTSLFRVMIICLLNVLRAEARNFTNNFDLANNAANLWCYNQFLLLSWVIEEFIFFRPIHQAVHAPSISVGVEGAAGPGGPEECAAAEEGAGDESGLIGLHFDFGDDFDWSDGAIDALLCTPIGAAAATTASTPRAAALPGDNKGNLGRALDVPVIDKLLDTFSALKLASAATMPPSLLASAVAAAADRAAAEKAGTGSGSDGAAAAGGGIVPGSNSAGAAHAHPSATVVGEGGADKFERKMLDLFAREFRTWHDYRALLRLLSRATMAQNYRAQSEHAAELVALVRRHQDERIKTLTSLANYSKKSSGFFGSGFGSNKSAASLRSGYGLKVGSVGAGSAPAGKSGGGGGGDGTGSAAATQGVQLHPHCFGLINRVVARARIEGVGSGSIPAPGTPLSTFSSSGAFPSASSTPVLGAISAGRGAVSALTSNFAALEAASFGGSNRRSITGRSGVPVGGRRASLLQNEGGRVQVLSSSTDSSDKGAAAAAAAALLLARSKRTFQSIRHAKDFCERERRRSSVFTNSGSTSLFAVREASANARAEAKAAAAAVTAAAASPSPSTSPPSDRDRDVPLSPTSSRALPISANGRRNPSGGALGAVLGTSHTPSPPSTLASAAGAGGIGGSSSTPPSPSPSPGGNGARPPPPPPPPTGSPSQAASPSLVGSSFPPPPPPPPPPLHRVTSGGKVFPPPPPPPPAAGSSPSSGSASSFVMPVLRPTGGPGAVAGGSHARPESPALTAAGSVGRGPPPPPLSSQSALVAAAKAALAVSIAATSASSPERELLSPLSLSGASLAAAVSPLSLSQSPPARPVPTLIETDEDSDTVSDLAHSTPTGGPRSSPPDSSSPSSRPHSTSAGAALSCTLCSCPLPVTSFYERAGESYCAPCFLRRFLACTVCGERILHEEGSGPEESEEETRARVARETAAGITGPAAHQYLTLAEERIVHHRCLTCHTCSRPLAPVAPAPPAAEHDAATATAATASQSSHTLGSVSLFQHSGNYLCRDCYFSAHGHVCNHCHLLIASSESIQLAPEDGDDDDDDDGEEGSEADPARLPPPPLPPVGGATPHAASNAHASSSPAQPPASSSRPADSSVYYHLECFVCSHCSLDLRLLEEAQDRADEAAFAAGLPVPDPATRPPVYASDPDTRKVYCWKHFVQMERERSSNAATATAAAVAGAHSPSPPAHSSVPLFSPGTGPGSSPTAMPFTHNPLVLGLAPVQQQQPPQQQSLASAGSAQSLSSLIHDGDGSFDSFGGPSSLSSSGGGMVAIGEDAADTDLAHSYSRSRSHAQARHL